MSQTDADGNHRCRRTRGGHPDRRGPRLLRAQLRHALARLSPYHRNAVVETILRERPYAEVAAELGIPTGTLRTRVHYALRQLRAMLGPTESAACA